MSILLPLEAIMRMDPSILDALDTALSHTYRDSGIEYTRYRLPNGCIVSTETHPTLTSLDALCVELGIDPEELAEFEVDDFEVDDND